MSEGTVDELQINPTADASQKLLQILTAEPPDGEFKDFATPNMLPSSENRYCYTGHSSVYDKDYWWITMDHCYSRPWNWPSESNFLRPTKTLFMSKATSSRKRPTNPLAQPHDAEDLIDVVAETTEPAPIYDTVKAKQLMEECERHAALARVDGGNEDWEETISRVNWTPTQVRLFNGMMNVLNVDHLARLAHCNAHNEPIMRRATIDKSVERLRKLMATVLWEPKYTQWLHQLLIDNLSTQYLGAYLDIIQTLKSKLPNFVDKLMSGAHTSRLSILSYESLFPLLKRPWDPVAPSLVQEKPKKLPGSPVIVVVRSTPVASKRMLKWINMLSNLATVVTIPANIASSPVQKTTMLSCVDQMYMMTRNKIQDLKVDYPGKNIILVGFGFGATLALHIAQVEQVLCVISIGFSLLTAEGRRGEPDDNLLELQCPVLFVIGQCSNTALQEEMEDLRERMRVETGLIIVGSADDNLRLNKKLKKAEGITQTIADRCIVDEIGEFISGIILSPFPPHIRQSPTNLTSEAIKKAKAERKRYNSNTSSLDSEPPSPTPRITRPGQKNTPNLGRPPGSKSKTKLDTKWAQGIPSPSTSPPHLTSLNTPDTSSSDSFHADKASPNELTPAIKKIKTLKPTAISPDKIQNQHHIPTQSGPGKMPNLQNRSLSSLLQGDFQTLVQQPTLAKSGGSSIKVLENIKLSSGVASKMFSNTGKIIDMSKLSVINKTPGNSLVLLPEGKIKNIGPSIKLPAGGRYITSKRQLIGNKPPKPVKKMSYISQTLPPPTNLTTQDIMDLPIIFADDNQILDDANVAQSEVKNVPQLVTPNSKIISAAAAAGNKFMLISKPNNNFVISPSPKNVTATVQAKGAPKYTKIILSSKRVTEQGLVKIPSEMKKPQEIDLDNEISSNTVYKTKPDKSLEVLEPESRDNEPKKRTAQEAGLKEADEGEDTRSKVQKLE